MGLLDEIMQEAKDDVLQEEWDKTLLSAFKGTTYITTGFVVGKFMKDNKISIDKFHTLKRVPHYSRHYKTRIPRFIAAYLPDLNSKLYDSNMSDDELVAWMNKVNLDTGDLPADKHKANSERGTRVRTDQKLAANTIAAAFYKGAFGRRQWEQVKAVRSKK